MTLADTFRCSAVFMLVTALALQTPASTTFHVSLDGDDAHDGLRRETAFRTIQRGVDALSEGDTLRIAPGEYYEAVFREGLGGPDRETVIRAEIPGTVLLRGDVPAPPFRKLEGHRFVYVTEFAKPVHAVNETDTLTILTAESCLSLLDYSPGRFVHDAEAGKLYITTSDLDAPGPRHYTLSVTNSHGLWLEAPQRVVIDGLAATGFNGAGPRYPGRHARWGLIIGKGDRCVIRNAVAYLNGGGICLDTTGEAPGRNRVEFSRAYGNRTVNIFAHSPNRDIVSDCYTYRTPGVGIRFYGGGRQGSRMLRNLAWGEGMSDLNIKGTHGPARHSIALGAADIVDIDNCIIGKTNSKYFTLDEDIPPGNIQFLQKDDDFDPKREFADPDNLDFRLQADSRFRNAAPDGGDRGPFPYAPTVFHVRPDGDDAADGLSVGRAWRSLSHAVDALRPGDTLYLAGGTYAEAVTLAPQAPGDAPVRLRGRGVETVWITGPVTIGAGVDAEFERLRFARPVKARDSGALRFANCWFVASDTGLSMTGGASLRVEHCLFTAFADGALRLDSVGDVLLRGNLFDNARSVAVHLEAGAIRYSNYNAYRDAAAIWRHDGTTLDLEAVRARGQASAAQVRLPRFEGSGAALRLDNPHAFATGGPLGTGLGPYRELALRALEPRIVEGPHVHSVSTTTANLEWWTSAELSLELVWGSASETEQTIAIDARPGFNTHSLAGLTPGTDYTFRLRTLDAQGLPRDPGRLMRLTTATDAPAPRVYHVAPDGDDGASGLDPAQPWRTLRHAADRVRPGDTVLLAEGEYREAVRLRVSGDAAAPITFRAADGARVDLRGDGRTLPFAFRADGKHHLVFDGLHVADYGADYFQFDRGSSITIQRSMIDGRGSGSRPRAMRANHVRELTLRNNVLIQHFIGPTLANCPDFRAEHNVFFQNWIFHFQIYNRPDEPIILERNIFTDNLPDKRNAYLFEISYGESFSARENGYFFRMPGDERALVLFVDQAGDAMHTRNRMERLTLTEYLALAGCERSIEADPGFPALAAVDRDATDRDGNPVYPVDRLPGSARAMRDFLATHPDVVDRGIGLQPEAFEEF